MEHMEMILSDLQENTDFLSQVWSTADFALIWGWVQKAVGSMDLGHIATFCAEDGIFFEFQKNNRFLLEKNNWKNWNLLNDLFCMKKNG